jgi:prepilin-type N-terminal cleavage/methylation domain-containing protein
MISNPLRPRVFAPQPGLKAANSPGAQAQQQGFSLIECLVAIIMVALVASAIAPALVISVATRVHSQKAEQALALAQSEIERTRVLVERGDYAVADLPPLAAGPLAAGLADAEVGTAAAPAELLTDLSAVVPANATQASPVDLNNDGEIDFFVQRYRAVGVLDLDDVPVAFAMGVRVYDGAATGTLSIEPASLVMTSSEAGRRTRPLVAQYTIMATSDQGESLCNMITYFNASAKLADIKTLPTLCL